MMMSTAERVSPRLAAVCLALLAAIVLSLAPAGTARADVVEPEMSARWWDGTRCTTQSRGGRWAELCVTVNVHDLTGQRQGLARLRTSFNTTMWINDVRLYRNGVLVRRNPNRVTVFGGRFVDSSTSWHAGGSADWQAYGHGTVNWPDGARTHLSLWSN